MTTGRRVACWISKATRTQIHVNARAPTPTHTHEGTRMHLNAHTQNYVRYFFSTATMVSGTRLIVTLYVHCLYCCYICHYERFISDTKMEAIFCSVTLVFSYHSGQCHNLEDCVVNLTILETSGRKMVACYVFCISYYKHSYAVDHSVLAGLSPLLFCHCKVKPYNFFPHPYWYLRVRRWSALHDLRCITYEYLHSSLYAYTAQRSRKTSS